MNPERRRDAVRRALTALWAMGTVVLVLVIVLLVYTMIEQGQNPLALTDKIKPPPAADHSTDPAPRQRTKEIKLFFAAPDGRQLLPEPRSIEFSDGTVDNCRRAIEALIQGPSAPDTFSPILPAESKVRALYTLENGELVIDFSQSQMKQQKSLSSAAAEALLVYGIVNTVTQPALQGSAGTVVKAVRFLFEGFAPPESFPGHVDLAAPVTPDPSWNEPAGAAAPETNAKGAARGST
ncbi:MAG: GerMN domain-containing protein [Candidatus Hydrogenedentes bacterium]|nr:GerMN domain-containing protein [Candidatus Hydrogenedentota bacterium]